MKVLTPARVAATLAALAKQRELEAEEARVADYRSIALAEIERASARIQGLEERASIARRSGPIASGGRW